MSAVLQRSKNCKVLFKNLVESLDGDATIPEGNSSGVSESSQESFTVREGLNTIPEEAENVDSQDTTSAHQEGCPLRKPKTKRNHLGNLSISSS